ncbi:MAG: hypothetical protein ACOX5R_15290 [bacterium]
MHPHVWFTLQEQITKYVERRVESEKKLEQLRKRFFSLLTGELSTNWEKWKAFAAQTENPHLVPDFNESPANVYHVNPNPAPGVIVATDGSQIFPSSHEIAPVALINISRIRINYNNYQQAPPDGQSGNPVDTGGFLRNPPAIHCRSGTQIPGYDHG